MGRGRCGLGRRASIRCMCTSGDEPELRANLEFLASDESPIAYAYIAKGGRLHAEPIPGTIKVAVVIKEEDS